MSLRSDGDAPVLPTDAQPVRTATGKPRRRGSRLLAGIPVPVRRMGVFALLPLLSTLSNLVLLPVVSAHFGRVGWTSLVLGQSIGAAASVICSLQWPTEGPALVTRATPDERTAIMRASMRSRAAAVLACVPLTLLLIAFIDRTDVLVCALSALSTTLIGLSPAWFVVGIGRPTLLVWLEGIPRLLGNLAALGLILAGSPLWTYPALLLATSAFTAGLSWLMLAGGLRYHGRRWKNDQDGHALRFATLARTLDAGYGFIAGPIVAVLAPTAYPVFAACDRLGTVANSGLVVVQQGAAGWVAEPESAERRTRRVRAATLYLLPLSFAVFAVLALTTPLLVRLLFSGTVSVSFLASALTGAIVAAGFLGHALFLTGLAPTGHARHGYRYLTVAFLVGMPALVVGALVAGAAGALFGHVLGGASLAALSLWRIRKSISHSAIGRRPSPEAAGPGGPPAGDEITHSTSAQRPDPVPGQATDQEGRTP